MALMKNSQIVNPSTELLPHVLNLCPCLSCVPCGNQVWGEGLQIEKPTISYGQQELLFGRRENQEAKSLCERLLLHTQFREPSIQMGVRHEAVTRHRVRSQLC